MQEEIKNEKNGDNKKIKNIIIIVIVIIILGLTSYVFLWFKSVKDRDLKAREMIKRIEKCDYINDNIQKERERCQQFVTQGEGNFGEFEYCKRYIDWSTSVLN